MASHSNPQKNEQSDEPSGKSDSLHYGCLSNHYNNVSKIVQTMKMVLNSIGMLWLAFTERVPKVNAVDPANLEILEFQAREMPGLNLHTDENDEIQDLKARLIISENARVEAEAKLNREIQEKKIQEEMISCLATRIEQLGNQSRHPVNRELKYNDEPKPSTSSMADGDSGNQMIPLKGRKIRYARSFESDPQPSCSTKYSESHPPSESGTVREQGERGLRGHAKKPHKKSKFRRRRQPRRERGVFTEEQYAISRADEKLPPGAYWTFTNPKTGEKTNSEMKLQLALMSFAMIQK
ncbi:hypothetical protein QAD02_010880 [Eretmocerus hayati]|uniref:Uncharacterized protein n=1 Tax=Eretmocerus hayati TaxID=131215 RepID=A0ACC2NXS1_9HYME|nr:hypothetical protein QAD02_010880 [Eretmocerus hayati]